MDNDALMLMQNLTIYHVLELKPMLLDALDKSAHLKLDLSNVTEIDSSGLQILIMLRREAKDHHKQLTLLSCSPIVQEMIDFCNLNHFFGVEKTSK